MRNWMASIAVVLAGGLCIGIPPVRSGEPPARSSEQEFSISHIPLWEGKPMHTRNGVAEWSTRTCRLNGLKQVVEGPGSRKSETRLSRVGDDIMIMREFMSEYGAGMQTETNHLATCNKVVVMVTNHPPAMSGDPLRSRIAPRARAMCTCRAGASSSTTAMSTSCCAGSMTAGGTAPLPAGRSRCRAPSRPANRAALQAMKRRYVLCACLASCVVFAGERVVAPELLGTWAATARDCRRPGPGTLTISTSSVQLHKIRGTITDGWTPGFKTIEVAFETSPGTAHGRDTRTYSLASDGRKLIERRGREVMATRVRC